MRALLTCALIILLLLLLWIRRFFMVTGVIVASTSRVIELFRVRIFYAQILEWFMFIIIFVNICLSCWIVISINIWITHALTSPWNRGSSTSAATLCQTPILHMLPMNLISINIRCFLKWRKVYFIFRNLFLIFIVCTK